MSNMFVCNITIVIQTYTRYTIIIIIRIRYIRVHQCIRILLIKNKKCTRASSAFNRFTRKIQKQPINDEWKPPSAITVTDNVAFGEHAGPRTRTTIRCTTVRCRSGVIKCETYSRFFERVDLHVVVYGCNRQMKNADGHDHFKRIVRRTVVVRSVRSVRSDDIISKSFEFSPRPSLRRLRLFPVCFFFCTARDIRSTTSRRFVVSFLTDYI